MATRRQRIRALIVAGTLGVVWVCAVWPVLLGRTFSLVAYGQTSTYPWGAYPPLATLLWPQSDQVESSYPWAAFTHVAWRSGQWPLWDPHGYAGGAPFAVNGMGGLYPIRIVTDTILSGARAHDAFLLLHLAGAAVGMYWLCRRLGLRMAGSLIGAAGWMTSSTLWSVVQLEMLTPFFAWLPLTLAALDQAMTSRRRRHYLVAAVVSAMALVSGNIVYAFIVVLTSGGYAAAIIVAPVLRRTMRDRREALSRLRASALVGAGAGLLGAYVLLPTALNLLAATRQPNTYAQIAAQTVSLPELLRSLIETPAKPPTAASIFQQVYTAPALLVAAVIGLVIGRGKVAAVGRLLTVVPALMVVGGPATWVAYHVLPGLTTIVPVRLLPVMSVGICVLAAAGAQRAIDLAVAAWQRRTVGAASLMSDAAWLVRAGLALVVVLAVALPGVQAARRMNAPAVKDSAHPGFARTPAISALLDQRSSTGWPLRVVQTQMSRRNNSIPPSLTSLVGDTPLVFGIDSWGGYDSSVPLRTAQILSRAAGSGGTTFPQTHPVYLTAVADWDLLSRLGADLVFAPPAPGPGVADYWGSLDPARLVSIYQGPDARVYRLAGSSSGPYLSSSVAAVPDGLLAAMTALEAQGRARIRQPIVQRSDLQRDPLTGLAGSGSVREASLGIDGATVQVDTTGPQLLVIPISDTSGWTVRVGGHGAKIMRVDYNYIGVRVPTGQSTVELSYLPPGWTAGWAVTGAAGLGLLLSWVTSATHYRRAVAGVAPRHSANSAPHPA